MPTVNRILESALYVEDVAGSAAFYQRLFGLEPMVSNEPFCALAVPGGQVLLLFRKKGTLDPLVLPNGDLIPGHGGEGQLHFAFGIDALEMESWKERLGENGVSIISTVHWEAGGESIYFHDPDGHVVELATRGTWPIY